MGIGCSLIAAAVFGFVALGGIFFYATLGQSHGPGLELALLGGMLMLGMLGLAWWLRRREERELEAVQNATNDG